MLDINIRRIILYIIMYIINVYHYSIMVIINLDIIDTHEVYCCGYSVISVIILIIIIVIVIVVNIAAAAI